MVWGSGPPDSPSWISGTEQLYPWHHDAGQREANSPQLSNELNLKLVSDAQTGADPRFWSRGTQRSFDPRGAPEPKICIKVPEKCMILKKSWGAKGGRAPIDPLVDIPSLWKPKGLKHFSLIASTFSLQVMGRKPWPPQVMQHCLQTHKHQIRIWYGVILQTEAHYRGKWK